jgi:sorbitol/mannitol transport system substrate-binding protein
MTQESIGLGSPQYHGGGPAFSTLSAWPGKGSGRASLQGDNMQLKTSLALAAGLLAAAAVQATDLVVATVNNGHMIEMQKLTKHFEQAHPDIHVKWVTLEEGVLRQRVTTDIATKGGQFDVMTIGMYETPIWGKKGWLNELKPDAAYDVDDLLPAMRNGLSVNGKLYASPFYGESSMLMYRSDLAQKAGVTFAERPTWDQVRDAAAKMHDPANGVYGICLRGKPGWGDNMAFITTMANAFGGQWFDMGWKPQLESKPWKDAVTFYVDMMKKYGPPGSSSNSFNEILALYNQGKCAMWVDATIAASFITDPKQSKVADKVAFAQAPKEVTDKGANWLWAWALAIPAGSKNADAAQKFINWATSKEYIQLVAKEEGWGSVPTGTRKSTYLSREFRGAAKFAEAEQKAIFSANPNDSTLPKSPYVGVQYAAIPEFQAIGIAVGQQMSAALAGKTSVDDALKASQAAADREMRKAGYYK